MESALAACLTNAVACLGGVLSLNCGGYQQNNNKRLLQRSNSPESESVSGIETFGKFAYTELNAEQIVA